MSVNIRTIKDIKLFLTDELNGLYPEPEISALTNIIKTKLGYTKLQMLAFSESIIPANKAGEVVSIARQLKSGKPIQYILGETNFYNCIFKVDGSTLIPRPETEEMVDLIIKENKGFNGSIIDVGTGSGCIAVALAKNIPGANLTGTDISDAALTIAKENASINNVRVTFFRSDILNFTVDPYPKSDIIVSNPPYIRESEKIQIAKNVMDFEPHEALFVPDSDPLKYYKAILVLAGFILTGGGKIYFEINEAMGSEMCKILITSGYSSITVIKDINGKERIVKGIKNG